MTAHGSDAASSHIRSARRKGNRRAKAACMQSKVPHRCLPRKSTTGWTLALVLWREAERGFEAWSCLRDIKTGSLLRVSISGPTALVSVLVTASVKAYACTP